MFKNFIASYAEALFTFSQETQTNDASKQKTFILPIIIISAVINRLAAGLLKEKERADKIC